MGKHVLKGYVSRDTYPIIGLFKAIIMMMKLF